jgi:glycosyltransferase involved in cell wall biosynthesis
VSAPNPSVLFASYHAYLDRSSGAALSNQELLEDLSAHGWTCRVVCGPQLDSEDRRGPADVLREYQVPHHLERRAPAFGKPYELFHYTLGGVPVCQYCPEGFTPHEPPTQDEGVPFLDVLSRTCHLFRPQVVLTYGGSAVSPHLIRRAKKAGARVIFSLHNFAYQDRTLFCDVDALRVPSQYARTVYKDRLGVDVEVVEYPRNLSRARAERVDGRFVTFVNPIPIKGSAWFARIAVEVAARRPEIPFLVVEGRGGLGWLRRVPVDWSIVTNLHGMHSTPYPKEFYSQSRVVLVPSLWEESFGRVAAEALANGIPVLASRRGALPETLGGAGFLFDIPDRYTEGAGMTQVPSSAEVAGWVETIERLWDDAAFYDECRAQALERAQVWEPDRLRAGVEAFFRQVASG